MENKNFYDYLLKENNTELDILIENEKKALIYNWFNDNKETMDALLSDYEYNLDFIEDIESTHDKNLILIGMLNGMVECLSILNRERTYDAMASAGMAEKHAIKHYDEVVLELSRGGYLNHSELCERLKLEANTLTAVMKKIVPYGELNVVKWGKYKYYSLTDSGRRYARQLMKQIQVNNETKDEMAEQSSIFFVYNEKNIPDEYPLQNRSVYKRKMGKMSKWFYQIINKDKQCTKKIIYEYMNNTNKPAMSKEELKNDIEKADYVESTSKSINATTLERITQYPKRIACQ